MFKQYIRKWIHPTVSLVRRRLNGTSPEVKVAQRQLYHFYRNLAATGATPALSETGFLNFSHFEEDGKLLFIFAVLGIPSGTFVDLGSSDGINSNCANLALNFGWKGLFVDGNGRAIEGGRRYYGRHPDTWAYPPKFAHAMVTRESINGIFADAGMPREIDFLSIDIDGNDYWVWEALEYSSPKVVMIETHIEFGARSIVVPYDKDYVYPGRHPDYHGASVAAMAKLAAKKGYRLVGSNDYGFNTIYVRNGIGEDVLPAVSVESVLSHPRNAERAARFEAIKDWDYLEV
jgi:hypothetical protein